MATPGASSASNVAPHHNHAPPPQRQVSRVSEPKTRSGIFGASSNLVNAIVGAGIVGIPYAIREAGFVAGLLLLVLVGFLTDKSLRIIIELASFHPKLGPLGVKTYEDLMMIPFGKAGAYFVFINMFILAYGAMVAYLLIIKDTVPVVFGWQNANDDNHAIRQLTMVISSLLIIVPLSMMRDMASLAFTSMISVAADVILVVLIVIFSPVPSSVSEAGGIGQVLAHNSINSKLFIGLGVLSTAMACQHSAFIVSNSLQDCTPQRWSSVTFRSISLATLMCIMLGVTGYLGFLDATQGDILNNFPSDSTMANSGRALLAITMFLTYPMESFVARHVVVQLFYNGDMDNNMIGSNGEILPESKWCGIIGRRERVTFMIYFATLVPALIVHDLGPVLSLTGSLGASCLSYIGPGLAFLGVNGQAFIQHTNSILDRRGYSLGSTPKSSNTPSELELPVVGDPQAHTKPPIETSQPPITMARFNRPWWYWLFGWPIWTAIASTGAKGMSDFISQEQLANGPLLDSYDSNVQANNDSTIAANTAESTHTNYKQRYDMEPRTRDFYLSMFFITFGVLAAVIGVVSNIYVQVHNIFFNPK